MIDYTIATTQKDLEGILHLQKINLPAALTKDEMKEQGFVTVEHSLEDLAKLNRIEAHVIGKEQDVVIAYLLAMTEKSKDDIPILLPLFSNFEKISYKGQLVANYNYLVVGQVCVAKDHRGKSVLDNCYDFYRRHFMKKYDFAITEIDKKNLRSMKAHERVGFSPIHEYIAPNKQEWSILLWDWRV